MVLAEPWWPALVDCLSRFRPPCRPDMNILIRGMGCPAARGGCSRIVWGMAIDLQAAWRKIMARLAGTTVKESTDN